ncbi:hypothetical protein OIU77_031014 [Salix suchowensis]|uniref:Uncharacterized protein n=1 Tax=Salix suchowensis TaxID=1278906 RepID=A0ABQ9BG46_9ROSI|nr:hypothetical protein OIU77_031014 [Salix suchowensis]
MKCSQHITHGIRSHVRFTYLLRYINTCCSLSYAHLANFVNIINYYSRDRNPFHITHFIFTSSPSSIKGSRSQHNHPYMYRR